MIEAEAAYRAVLREWPQEPNALHLLGVLAGQQGDLATGQALIRQAVALRPDVPAFHANLGKLLEDAGDLDEAIASYRQAIALAPNYADAHFNLGAALQGRGDYLSAEAAYRRVLQLNPSFQKAAHNLGVVLLGMGRAGESISVLRAARALQPDADTHRTILQAILYDDGISATDRFAEHQAFGRELPRIAARPHANDRRHDRRLKIGWISSDFRDHPVARNLEPVFAGRDPQAATYICYADVAKPDAITGRFRALADGWRDIAGESDAAVADLIRRDEIDILVVLAGRFDRNRLSIAAYGAAPIHVSFHDPATSGTPGMDYLIADPILVPRRSAEKFVERVLHLPSFYIHAPLDEVLAIGPPPSSSAGFVTFGSFNNPAKLTEPVLQAWAAILSEVPNSRLLLKYHGRLSELGGRVRETFSRRGITPERIEISTASTDHARHLALYDRVDIALDPFPFNGSTTTFEALWMGVPVVTLAGGAMVGRWGASMLHVLRLDDLVAATPRDYHTIAVALAADTGRRSELRKTLRERITGSPLCDGRARARQLQRLFSAVWRRWCTNPS